MSISSITVITIIIINLIYIYIINYCHILSQSTGSTSFESYAELSLKVDHVGPTGSLRSTQPKVPPTLRLHRRPNRRHDIIQILPTAVFDVFPPNKLKSHEKSP